MPSLPYRSRAIMPSGVYLASVEAYLSLYSSTFSRARQMLQQSASASGCSLAYLSLHSRSGEILKGIERFRPLPLPVVAKLLQSLKNAF